MAKPNILPEGYHLDPSNRNKVITPSGEKVSYYSMRNTAAKEVGFKSYKEQRDFKKDIFPKGAKVAFSTTTHPKSQTQQIKMTVKNASLTNSQLEKIIGKLPPKAKSYGMNVIYKDKTKKSWVTTKLFDSKLPPEQISKLITEELEKLAAKYSTKSSDDWEDKFLHGELTEEELKAYEKEEEPEEAPFDWDNPPGDFGIDNFGNDFDINEFISLFDDSTE